MQNHSICGVQSLDLDAFLYSHRIWESIGFMWNLTFPIFIKSRRFKTPWVRNTFLRWHFVRYSSISVHNFKNKIIFWVCWSCIDKFIKNQHFLYFFLTVLRKLYKLSLWNFLLDQYWQNKRISKLEIIINH